MYPDTQLVSIQAKVWPSKTRVDGRGQLTGANAFGIFTKKINTVDTCMNYI